MFMNYPDTKLYAIDSFVNFNPLEVKDDASSIRTDNKAL